MFVLLVLLVLQPKVGIGKSQNEGEKRQPNRLSFMYLSHLIFPHPFSTLNLLASRACLFALANADELEIE